MKRIGNPRVDVSISVPFKMDDKSYCGVKGDTLASALLANGVKLMGRSFKYHRPRGVLTAGSEEPNALFEIGEGAYRVPNVRATEQELYSGLYAHSQNRAPSLRHDFLALNDHLSPFFSAGFYYKTFMWPKAAWEKLYEPMIRRAAGLGALSGTRDPSTYSRGYLFCDVLVIGSGLSGLLAAREAARAGLDVLLIEGDALLGGRLLTDKGDIASEGYGVWRDRIVEELETYPNLRIKTRTNVTGVYDGNTFGALERVSEHIGHDANLPNDLPREIFWRIVAKEAILASGAIERPIAFPNNDRPQIMMAGAARSYLNRFGVLIGQKIAVFGNNSSAWESAADFAAAGADVVMIDPREDTPKTDAFRVTKGEIVDTKGRLGVREVSVRTTSGVENIAVDAVAMSGGWNPNLHLTSHKGARPVYDEAIASFVPRARAVKGLTPVGAANGAMSDAAIIDELQQVLPELLNSLGKQATMELPTATSKDYHIAPLWQVKGEKNARAWLDFQNDVTVKDVALAHRENFTSVEHMKRYTTLGMATDQGKTSNINALAVMAALTGQSIEDTGTTTYRPPFTPISIGALGADAAGKGFQPERYTPSHEFAIEKGAVMIEAGLWYRASYFKKTGDNHWRDACDREVNMVRNAVGICDVSTLGKIDLKGRDAAVFLDWLYTGKMSTLKLGKVRYGLMLREDGFVMDDGTCARIGDDHYRLTTTTVAAGAVMQHMEFVHQCLCPELDVKFISTTDCWAQFSVAGPLARHLLNQVVEEDVTDETVPYMGAAPISVGGVDGMLFRISFSGEHAYEIAVPREYGDALCRALITIAETMEGGLYGLEALNVMRIEKGFITHSEIDGRVTAEDCGFGKMISPSKDVIGKVMAARPYLLSEARGQLVGIKPVGSVQKLLAGSRFVVEGADVTRTQLEGYVTSVCYSPTLGHMIGLGFLTNGRARKGETIRAVDLARDFDTVCEVVDPVFFDPEGERLYAEN